VGALTESNKLTFFLVDVSNAWVFDEGRSEKIGRFVAIGCAIEACRPCELVPEPPRAEVPRVLPKMELPSGCVLDSVTPPVGPAGARPNRLVPPPKALFVGWEADCPNVFPKRLVCWGAGVAFVWPVALLPKIPPPAAGVVVLFPNNPKADG
jgi:hypothetical protein